MIFFFKLEIETNTEIQWLKDNEMIANPSRFQPMFFSNYKNIEKKILSFDGKYWQRQIFHQILDTFH